MARQAAVGAESRGCSLHPPLACPCAAERVQCGMYLQVQSNAKEEETEREKDNLVLATVSVSSLAGGCRLQVHPCCPGLEHISAGSVQPAGSSSESWLWGLTAHSLCATGSSS